MQFSDMNLVFVESDSILDPVTPHSSMSAIRKSNSLSFHPVCDEAAQWKLALLTVRVRVRVRSRAVVVVRVGARITGRRRVRRKGKVRAMVRNGFQASFTPACRASLPATV